MIGLQQMQVVEELASNGAVVAAVEASGPAVQVAETVNIKLVTVIRIL